MTRDEVLRALRASPPPLLEPPSPDREDGPAVRRAAVLVPLVDRAGGFTVVFGRRSRALKRHAGEVCFPGGRIEAGEDEADAALREAEEEVGLDPARVEIVARLDSCRAGSGYAIAPHVGLVRPPVILAPDGAEIEEAFEAPLRFLLDPANRRRETMRWRGAESRASVFEVGPRVIWGATAAMLENLLRILRGER